MSAKAIIRSVLVVNVLVLILTFACIVWPNFYFGLRALEKRIVVIATAIGLAGAIWAGSKVKGGQLVVIGLVGAADIAYLVLLWSANIL